MRNNAAPPSDREIRAALRRRLETRHTRESDTVLIEELGLCRGTVRVDLVVVNGLVHGYEIKSDRDSLRRLASQVSLYSSVLDRATLVAGEGHLDRALNLVPAWWGVLRVERRRGLLRLVQARRGTANPARNPRAIAELLWRDEALALLAERGASRGVRTKPRAAVWDRVCERVPPDEIAAAVRERLRARARNGSARPPS